jgi:hypothetical protein
MHYPIIGDIHSLILKALFLRDPKVSFLVENIHNFLKLCEEPNPQSDVFLMIVISQSSHIPLASMLTSEFTGYCPKKLHPSRCPCS